MTGVNCYKCTFSESIAGDTHLKCINHEAKIKVNQHGVQSGWCSWPFNFDPIWLISCDGYMDKEVIKKTTEAFYKLLTVLENDKKLKELKTDAEKIDNINDHIETVSHHEMINPQHLRRVYNLAVENNSTK